jgi:hypothetical protein
MIKQLPYAARMLTSLYSNFLASGGSIFLEGGEGLHTSPHDGSDGGSVLIVGGASHGFGWDDHGGSIEINGGGANRGTGGDVLVSSGASGEASSKCHTMSVLLTYLFAM